MSQALSGVQGTDNVLNGGKNHIKCRIPQRLVPGRARTPLKPKSSNNNSESGKSKFEVVLAQHPRNVPRPRSEEASRPKSAGKGKEAQHPQPYWGQQPLHPAQLARQTRQVLEPTVAVSAQRLSDQVRAIQRLKRLDDSTLDRLRLEALPVRAPSAPMLDPPVASPMPALDQASAATQVGVAVGADDDANMSRPSALPKKSEVYTARRQLIMVPNTQQQKTGKLIPSANARGLVPDQESISKYDEHEICQNDHFFNSAHLIDSNDDGSVTSCGEKIMRLRIRWQDNIVNFENTKRQLDEMQKGLMELYASLRKTQKDMSDLGQKVTLPPSDDLRIMNVAELTPDQLLQLCAGTLPTLPESRAVSPDRHPFAMDINSLHEKLANIVDTCDQALINRTEIIQWFEEITSQKEISKNSLVKKVNQFKLVNEMLKCTLENNKQDYMRNINEAIDCLKKSLNDAVAYHMRSEELNHKLIELTTTNENLRKQIQHRGYDSRSLNRAKIEELEKELKEERSKKTVLRDRLSRAEGQMRTREEKAAQLEAAWEQAHSKTLSLERTIQQLREENQQLQFNFDEQLKKLTESIRESTQHLESIVVDREKLLMEKEDLEKRLAELSEHYNTALKNTKHETNQNVAKLIETEQKCNELTQEKTKLENKTESLCAQLIESELRFKDISQKLLEAESNLRMTAEKAADLQRELEATKYQLSNSNGELTEYKNLAVKQAEAINELEKNFKRSVESEEMFKSYLNNKDEYIIELQKQRTLLEQRLQESESHLQSYAEQLTCLKKHFSQLQDDFGDVENLEQIHKMVTDQRNQLQEKIEQNNVLAEKLKEKDIEMEQQADTLVEQSQLLEEKEAIIKMFSKKDDEQSNIITLLRNNLEIRAKADVDLNKQIEEKDAEIESLLSNVETRKEQISELEKIILALEDQTRKSSHQKRKDRETISLLEKRVAELENNYIQNRNLEAPTENLDHLIKMLEHELGTPFEGELNSKVPTHPGAMLRQKNNEQNKIQKMYRLGGHGENNSVIYKPQRENIPAKIVMGNFVKKTYISNEDQLKGDNLDRKQAITSMETAKWFDPPDPGMNLYTKASYPKDRKCTSFKGHPAKDEDTTRSIPYYMVPNHLFEEKKSKMYKLAGHRM